MNVRQVHPGRGKRLLIGFLLAAAAFSGLEEAQATKYAGAFMETGGGARALAMGGAFTAVASDPSATFWNPAALATCTGRDLMLMHSERFGDLIDRDFAAYTQSAGWNLLGGESSGLGVSLIRLGIDDIPFTDHLFDQLDDNGDGDVDDSEVLDLLVLQDEIQYKSDQEFALFFSYGELLSNGWQVGANVKLIRQSVGSYSSLGIGTDLALLRPRIWRGLDFGVKFQDITTTYLAWNTGHNELITPAIVPGLAYNYPLPKWNMNILVAGSLETRFDNRRGADQYWLSSASANAHTGLEVGFSGKVFIRGGFDSGWQAENLTAGAGFRVQPFTVDYAYAGDTLDIDEVTHRISVTVRF